MYGVIYEVLYMHCGTTYVRRVQTSNVVFIIVFRYFFYFLCLLLFPDYLIFLLSFLLSLAPPDLLLYWTL